VLAYAPALDGIRGLAIILVLLHHFTLLHPETWVGVSLQFVGALGWAGVDLFFVLSGFLITGILLDTRGRGRYFSSFYARRTLRIFPLYYLIVFLAFVVLPQFPWLHQLLVGSHDGEQWPYWTYLVNFEIARENDFQHGVLDVTWSLAIEEQFYLIWAVVVWALSPRWLGALCGAIMLAAPLARTAALAAGASPIDVYVLPHFRADALATGALLAWLWRRGALARLDRLSPWITIGAVAAAVAFAIADQTAWWWGTSTQRLGYSSFALAGAGLVTAAITRTPSSMWPRALSAGWLRSFGKHSYCLYLIHLPVMRLVRTLVLPPEHFGAFGAPWVGQLLFYVLATTPAFAIAWLSWRLYEAPILRLKNRFAY